MKTKNKRHQRCPWKAPLCFWMLLCLGLSVTGCGGGPAANVTASAAGQSIPVIAEDPQQAFAPLVSGKPLEEIPYVPLGSSMKIELGGAVPSGLVIEDILLREDGSAKYASEVNQSVDYIQDGNTVSFQLQTHPAVFLSSSGQDYLPGRTLRGIRLAFNREDKAAVYLLAVRTDAQASEK